MQKADVLAKLEQFKGRPIEIGLADEGAVLHSGIEGHWLFVKDDNLIEIKTNISDGTYGFSSVNQKERPFKVTVVEFDTVNYVRSYIGHTTGDIAANLDGLTPVGTAKTLAEIKTELEGNSIRKSQSPSGNLNDPNVAPGGEYGNFKGSMVSTEIDGIPKYVTDKLL